MRYRKPTEGEALDMLNDVEFRLAGTPHQALRRGRAKAWDLHRQTGPLGQIRALAEGPVGGSVLLRGYTSTTQTSQIVESAKRKERAHFRARLERHELSDEVIGVRVTFEGFSVWKLREDARRAASSDGSLVE